MDGLSPAVCFGRGKEIFWSVVINILHCFCYTIVVINVGTLSDSVILIGYYHGLLLRDIDADLLVGEMLSAELMNVHEHKLILSGHSLHHRNWLLLEHVRHLDSQSLQVFSELLHDMWPEIGLQLTTGSYNCMLGVYTLNDTYHSYVDI